jgi:dipeptidyl aminopeptidase/acylaminoacyl peptidase
MSDHQKTLERELERLSPPRIPIDRLVRRRDRKRRNQRITASVVGIAVFVAAVWIVRDVASLDSAHRPAIQPTETPTSAVAPVPPTDAPVSAVGTVPETDCLLDLNTGEMTPLPTSIGGGHGPGPGPVTDPNAVPTLRRYAASPDGSRLAYVDRGDNGRNQIFVANLDGTGIEQVSHDLETASAPAWSPDSSKIAYIGDHDGRIRDLFLLDLATGESTQLTFATHKPDPGAPDLTPWDVGWTSFTPDGSSIVYNLARSDRIWEPVDFEMRMVPVTGGESVRLADGVYEAALSPDGSLLAYAWRTPTSNRPGKSLWPSNCVCVSNTDGTGERELVQASGDFGNPLNLGGWSPDGTWIAYWESPSNNVSIVDLATGRAAHVGEGYMPTWLDDHTLIIEMDDCYNPATGQRDVEC